MKVRGGASAGVLAAASLVFLVMILAGCAPSKTLPPPTPPTARQRAAATRADLESRWATITVGAPSFTEPTVTVIRYTTFESVHSAVAGCLRAGDYPGTFATTEGVADPEVSPAEAFPFEVATFLCEARFPEEPVELGYLNAAQGRYLYGYWQQQLVPCLRSRGVIVADLAPLPALGTTRPPNRALVALNPYLKLTLPAGATDTRLESECPAFPRALVPGQ